MHVNKTMNLEILKRLRAKDGSTFSYTSSFCCLNFNASFHLFSYMILDASCNAAEHHAVCEVYIGIFYDVLLWPVGHFWKSISCTQINEGQ